MYLDINSYPDISLTLHQCSHFTHAPHQPHAKAVKFIIRYIKGT